MNIITYNEAVGIWDSAMKSLKDKISEQEYLEWFSPIEAVGYENGSLTIAVPSRVWMNHIEKNYIEDLSSILKSIVGPRVNLLYRIIEHKFEKRKPIENTILAPSSITCKNVMANNDMIVQSVLAAKATYPSGEISNALMLAISEALMPYLTNDVNVFESKSFLAGNFPVTFDTAALQYYSGEKQNKTRILELARKFMNGSEINFRYSYAEGRKSVEERWSKIITTVEDIKDTSMFRIYVNKDIIPFWLFINPQLGAPSIKVNKRIGYSFSGKYTLKMYNIILDFLQNDEGCSFIMEKKEFLEILGLDANSRYGVPSLLGERILRPSIKEIENQAGVSIKWSILSRNGEKVPKGKNNIRQSKIQFDIQRMTQEQMEYRNIRIWLEKHRASAKIISDFDKILFEAKIRKKVLDDIENLDKKQKSTPTLWPNKKKLNCLVANFLTEDKLF